MQNLQKGRKFFCPFVISWINHLVSGISSGAYMKQTDKLADDELNHLSDIFFCITHKHHHI